VLAAQGLKAVKFVPNTAPAEGLERSVNAIPPTTWMSARTWVLRILNQRAVLPNNLGVRETPSDSQQVRLTIRQSRLGLVWLVTRLQPRHDPPCFDASWH
jgi:hypothetical protein